MSLESDRMLDRRRLKRALSLWRFAAVAAVTMAATILAMGRGGDGIATGIGSKDHVARLEVTGVIVEDRKRIEALDDLIEDDKAKALIVYIDSPGGTMVGGESLYLALRKVAGEKPVVAVMGSMGTSAAYMAAIATDRVMVRAGSLTGSIGVIMAETDITGLLEKIGVKPEIVKSGPLKAQPNPLEPFTDEGRAAIRSVIMDSFEQFVAMVAERRNLPMAEARRLADGRVYTGGQAVENGLADAIGGEEEALAWLSATRGLDEDLPIEDVKIKREKELWKKIMEGFAGKSFVSETLALDGLVSLWHPSFLR